MRLPASIQAEKPRSLLQPVKLHQRGSRFTAKGSNGFELAVKVVLERLTLLGEGGRGLAGLIS